MKFSLLDLAPVGEGSDVRQAMKNSVRLAQAAEAAGYHRYWLAEHHNMPGIASAATSVMIGHVADHTTSIRAGAPLAPANRQRPSITQPGSRRGSMAVAAE